MIGILFVAHGENFKFSYIKRLFVTLHNLLMESTLFDFSRHSVFMNSWTLFDLQSTDMFLGHIEVKVGMMV